MVLRFPRFCVAVRAYLLRFGLITYDTSVAEHVYLLNELSEISRGITSQHAATGIIGGAVGLRRHFISW